MRSVLFIFAFFFVSSTAVNAQTTSPQQMEVMMHMLSLKNSLIMKDSVKLSNLLSDDVTYGHTNGMIQTKSELIRSIMSRDQDYKSIEPSEMKVRIYDNTAIVNMKSEVKMNYGGKPLELNMFVVLVWVKKDKDWKLVARQSVNSSLK